MVEHEQGLRSTYIHILSLYWCAGSSDDEEAEESQLHWVESLGLWKRDEKILRSGQWLNSSLINAAMGLVQEQFPEIKGLQETTRVLSKIKGLSCQSDGSIQVHYLDDIKHWVTSAMIGGDVLVYDSLHDRRDDISGDLRQQVATIYRKAAVDGKLQVLLPAVQQQKGGSDCGVFSIAYLFHISSR